jgi:ATP-dependent helicase HrpB
MYRDLMLAEKSVTPPLEEASALLAERAASAPVRALDLEDEDVRGFLARVGSLALWMPELALPAFDGTMLATVARELAEGRRSFEEMRRLPLREILEARLSYQQKRALREQAPEALAVPSGSEIRLRYELGRPPVLAVRIQELFGMRDSPRVAGGRIAVVVHLLAPNGRPQQVTDDLASFWRNTYTEIRKELRARYPRHSWPEDPLTAPPQRRPRQGSARSRR